jgi:hypothetical protein
MTLATTPAPAETKTLYKWGVKRIATLVAERPSIEQDPHTGRYAYAYCGRAAETKEDSTKIAEPGATLQWDIYMEVGTGRYLTIHKDA